MTFPPALSPPLTDRQLQIFELLAHDLSYKMIGAKLGIKESTVKGIACEGRKRLGVSLNAAAVYRLRDQIQVSKEEA